MRILIVTPAAAGSTKGNRITAERWATLLSQLEHEVRIETGCVDGDFDCMITLHATRSHPSMVAFQKSCPGKPIALCLTGTDLHLDLVGKRSDDSMRIARESLKLCDRIVLLEPEGARQLPAEFQDKVVVIVQSANAVEQRSKPSPELFGEFVICIVGHLRTEKDPFLAAEASRLLPADSRITIAHYGEALSPEIEEQARQLTETNPRYAWHGPLAHFETMQKIAASQLMLLTSRVEGAPSVISEAIVNTVPVLATKIPASIGLLGSDYPGLFPVGDTKSLFQMMLRAERDAKFLESLKHYVASLAPRFSADVEKKSLGDLLSLLCRT